MAAQANCSSRDVNAGSGAGSCAARRCMLALTATGTALGLMALLPSQPRLVWNLTESVPVGLYWIDPVAPGRGDTVALQPSPSLSAWLERAGVLRSAHILIKPLAGRAGDRVCRVGLSVTVNGMPVAQARAATGAGDALPAWSGCHNLDGDDLFLIAPHPDSFDSRYFGPVSALRVLGIARPVFLLPSARERR